jgi:FkbM family methyltransferase
MMQLRLHGADFDVDDFQVQRQLLRGLEANTIIDAGANVGNTSAVYAEFFPEASVYAFEPFPASFERLKSRFAGEPRIRPFELAISDRRGTGILYINGFADTNSLLPRPRESRRYYADENSPSGSVEVPLLDLDTFARDQGLQRINVLKLDLQGGERDALAGAKGLLGRGAIDLIYSEVFFAPHYEGAWMFHEIAGYLAGFGYTVYNLFHLVTARNGQLRFGDALFVSADIRAAVVDATAPEP